MAALRRAVRELVLQSGRGISRQALVDLAGSTNGYRIEIYGGDPPFALARPCSSTLFSTLTAREREVAALVARGLANSEIASELVISEATVKDHVHSILRKTSLRTRAAVAGSWGT